MNTQLMGNKKTLHERETANAHNVKEKVNYEPSGHQYISPAVPKNSFNALVHAPVLATSQLHAARAPTLHNNLISQEGNAGAEAKRALRSPLTWPPSSRESTILYADAAIGLLPLRCSLNSISSYCLYPTGDLPSGACSLVFHPTHWKNPVFNIYCGPPLYFL